MTTRSAYFMQTYYSGTIAAKLTVARGLFEDQAPDLLASPVIIEALESLRHCALALDGQMRTMDLGRLCSRCAARSGGGCCSAFMAGNTDSILLLINLLLGVPVQSRNNGEENCCYLGERGCLFLVKPIFCLNYNCKQILDRTDTENLDALYRFAAGVLSQQTRVEGLLLEALPDPRAGAIHS